MTRIIDRVRLYLDHTFAERNLSAYVDERLTERERARVERHLAVCEACREDLATLRQTVALLRSAPQVRVPRSFALPRSVQDEQARYRRWDAAFVAMRNLTVAASVLLVLLISGDAVLNATVQRLPMSAPRAAQVMSPDVVPAESAPEFVQDVGEPVLELSVPEPPVEAEALTASPAEAPEASAGEPEEPALAMVPAPPEAAPEVEASSPAEQATEAASAATQPAEDRSRGVAAAPEGGLTETPGTVLGTGDIRAGEVPSAESGAPPPRAGAPPPEPALPAPVGGGTTNAGTEAAEPEAADPAQQVDSVEPAIPPATEPAEVWGTDRAEGVPSGEPEHLALVPPSTEVPAQESAAQTDADLRATLALEQRPLWAVWQAVRIAAGLLFGLLLVLLGGLVWVGYRRRSV